MIPIGAERLCQIEKGRSMSNDTMNKIAEAWVRMYQAKEDSSERDENFWAYNKLSDLGDQDPEGCFEIIEIIRRMTTDDSVLANLTSGPLEDLLAKHGSLFIDRIERAAKSDAQVRRLLGAVWQNAIPDSIWKRIQLIADPTW